MPCVPSLIPYLWYASSIVTVDSAGLGAEGWASVSWQESWMDWKRLRQRIRCIMLRSEERLASSADVGNYTLKGPIRSHPSHLLCPSIERHVEINRAQGKPVVGVNGFQQLRHTAVLHDHLGYQINMVVLIAPESFEVLIGGLFLPESAE